MCEEVAYPFASVNARIGRHIVSLATLMNLVSTHSATIASSRTPGAQRNHAPVNNLVQTELIGGVVVDVSRKLFEFTAGRVRVQRLLFGLAENLRKIFRDKPSEEQVGVGHR